MAWGEGGVLGVRADRPTLSWLYLVVVALLSSQRLDTLFASFVFCGAPPVAVQAIPISYPAICLVTALWIGIFTKLSFTPAAAAALLVLAGVELSQPSLSPLRKLIQALLIPGAALLALLPSGMDPAQAWIYISGANRHVVSGYSEAMALHRRKNDWMQLPYWLGPLAQVIAIKGLQTRLRTNSPWLLTPIAGLFLCCSGPPSRPAWCAMTAAMQWLACFCSQQRC